MPDPTAGCLHQFGLDVSRETLERLQIHFALLKKWNPAINLVSSSTLELGWERHILDSVQVFQMANQTDGRWLDFGSGGGFPGLVCAILAAELAPKLSFTLVESDKRKCTFLTTVLRETGTVAQVVPRRIETLEPMGAQIVSARAVAMLSDLLTYAEKHLNADGYCVFPKGARYARELDDARQKWCFKVQAKPSITDPNAVILRLGDITRA